MNIGEKTTSKNVSKFMRNTVNSFLNLTGKHRNDLKKPVSCDIPNADKTDPDLKEYF